MWLFITVLAPSHNTIGFITLVSFIIPSISFEFLLKISHLGAMNFFIY